jgi:hypothetical protein
MHLSRTKYFLSLIWLFVSHRFRKSYKANICGHQTKKKGRITSFGESYIMEMPLQENGNPDYCLECIAKMAIKCAWCGQPIHIGSPVTLYAPREKDHKMPECAVRYKEGEPYFVGCLRWDCADSGMDRQGFWVPPGEVERVPSPLEIMLAPGNEGKGVIISDLSNPNDLGKTFNV